MYDGSKRVALLNMMYYKMLECYYDKDEDSNRIKWGKSTVKALVLNTSLHDWSLFILNTILMVLFCNEIKYCVLIIRGRIMPLHKLYMDKSHHS